MKHKCTLPIGTRLTRKMKRKFQVAIIVGYNKKMNKYVLTFPESRVSKHVALTEHEWSIRGIEQEFKVVPNLPEDLFTI